LSLPCCSEGGSGGGGAEEEEELGAGAGAGAGAGGRAALRLGGILSAGCTRSSPSVCAWVRREGKRSSRVVASLSSPSPTRSHGEHRALASSGLRLISAPPIQSRHRAVKNLDLAGSPLLSPSCRSPDPRSPLHARTPDELDDGAFDGNDDYYGASPPSIDPCVYTLTPLSRLTSSRRYDVGTARSVHHPCPARVEPARATEPTATCSPNGPRLLPGASRPRHRLAHLGQADPRCSLGQLL
jgi:hypothetical protein